MPERARHQSGYSRFVRIVKVVLPLLAIALLSTVFLVQRDVGFDGQLVFSDIDRNALGDGLTVRNPEITGVSSGGDAFRISAATAIPDGPRPQEIRFTKLNSQTNFQSGLTLSVAADQGRVDIENQVMQVEGAVVVETSDGYVGRTEEALVNIRDGVFETKASVSVEGPLGKIEAGKLKVEDGDDGEVSEQNRHFLFENGVKLIFLPEAAD